MKRAITAILKNDIYELKNAFLSFGKPTEKIDHASLYTDLDDMVGKYMNMDFGDHGSWKIDGRCNRAFEET